MRQHCHVRLAPIDDQWVRAFVVAALRAIERWPDPLTFGTDQPVLRVRLVRGGPLAAGARYEGDTDGLLGVTPAPYGFLTIRSWKPAGMTSVSAAATNVVAAGDLATAHVDLTPGTLGCTAFYHAAGASPPLTDLLWLRARVDVDLRRTALVRATLSHALVSMTLEVRDDEVEVEVRSPWWARPLLNLALAYVRHNLRRRYGAELDQTVSFEEFEEVVQLITAAWNDAVPGLVSQSPDRLADELLSGVLYAAE